MSIADKLTLLINTKQDIKSAISEKGVEVTGGMTTYADAIRRIETGGGGDSIYVPIGLKFTYKAPNGPYTAPDFTLPKLILADGYTDGSYMFEGNLGLINITGIYSTNSSLTNCSRMFHQCTKLTTIPQLDTSNVTDMSFMFYECTKLTTIPQLDTSKVTDMTNMFASCNLLTTIPQLDTSKVTDMYYMFWKCISLITIPQLDTSKVTDMFGMFLNCPKLESLPMLNCVNVTNVNNMFGTDSSITTSYPNLTDLGGFKNLKVSLKLSGMPNLTVQSLMNVINNLYDFVGNGSATTRTLTLGTTNLNKLTAEQKAVATNKGWVLA